LVFDATVVEVAMDVVSIDADLVFDAVVSEAILQTIDFAVSSSSELEGSPIVQTIDFAVSPSSELEG
jgi:hypothetical protein